MSLLLSFLLIFTGAFTFSTNSEYYVTASSCYLYEDASFESKKIQVGEEDVVINHGQKVVVKNETNDFCYITIKNTEINGYIYKYYLAENNSISYHPVFNASIRKESAVYDINLNETEMTIKQNQRVYLYEGFDSKKEYTAIQFSLEDGSVFNGYVLTENIAPDGVSRLLIIGIPLILATVTIVLSIVLIRKKKKS